MTHARYYGSRIAVSDTSEQGLSHGELIFLARHNEPGAATASPPARTTPRVLAAPVPRHQRRVGGRVGESVSSGGSGGS